MSIAISSPNLDDRRGQLRHAASGSLDISELGTGSLPARAVAGAQAINISAGGMAFYSTEPLQTGGKVVAMIGNDSSAREPAGKVFLEILDCAPHREGGFRVRCRFIGGAIPAKLVVDRGDGRFLI